MYEVLISYNRTESSVILISQGKIALLRTKFDISIANNNIDNA